MSIHVVQPGILTLLQDMGRPGYRAQGVVVSGAMDRFAHQVVNWLAGNKDDRATLEVTLGGLQLLFEETALIAIGGYGIRAFIDNVPVDCWRPLQVMARSLLQLQYTGTGCRSYVAIHGGWQAPLLLNSYSTYLPAGWGGYEGRALKKGDILQAAPGAGFSPAAINWSVAASALPAYSSQPVIRAIQGPEWLDFTAESREAFYYHPHAVLPQSNRMGYRLEAAMKKTHAGELLSTAVCAGTIQVLPDGNLVLMMNDAPATGGYPRIAQVIEADLSYCAQLVSGAGIQFIPVSPEAAEEVYLAYRHQMRELQQYITNRLYQ